VKSSCSFICLVALAVVTVGAQQATPPTAAQRIARFPPTLRPIATRFLDTRLSEEERLGLLEQLLEGGPETTPLLVSALPTEPSAGARAMIVGGIDFDGSADAAAAVAARAQSDPSANVRRLASARIRWEQVAALKRGARTLRDLATASRTSGAVISGMETEVARRESVPMMAGAGLPAPPPVFSASTDSTIRVLVLGDFGTKGSGAQDTQERVAALMAAFHKVTPFTFGITVGDNFYRTGLDDVTSERWHLDWEKPYSGLKIPFWAVAGNHDWDGTVEAIKAEIAYTDVSPSQSWRMPSTHYTFTAGPVQFFALDTDDMHKSVKDDQLEWLETQAAQSTAPWRIAFGHHPVLTGGAGHGAGKSFGEAEDDEIRILREKVLLPVLRKASQHVYVAGHDHELQLLDLKGIFQVVSGGGGRESDGVKKLPESLFCAKAFGFTAIEASANRLSIRFAGLGDQPGKYRYSCDLNRAADGSVTQQCATACQTSK
jgi:tartrate-resistant acid phosphatase type 5